MTASAPDFAKSLGASIAELLGGEFKYFRSKLELTRTTSEGVDVIRLALSSKYSPHVSAAFYFGKRYAAVTQLERTLGGYAFPYHVQQYSPGRQPLYAATYQGSDNWDITLPHDATDLARHMFPAITGMAFPFFEQFQNPVTARNAIASGSPSCFSGAMFWRQLLLLDAAIGQLEHFADWMACLDDWTRNQAESELSNLRATLGVA